MHGTNSKNADRRNQMYSTLDNMKPKYIMTPKVARERFRKDEILKSDFEEQVINRAAIGSQ